MFYESFFNAVVVNSCNSFLTKFCYMDLSPERIFDVGDSPIEPELAPTSPTEPLDLAPLDFAFGASSSSSSLAAASFPASTFPDRLTLSEKLYLAAASRGRDGLFHWLRTHREARVLGVLSSFASNGARGYPAAVVGNVVNSSKSVTFTRRACSAITSAASTAAEAGAAFLWLPVRLQREGYEDHANAIWISMKVQKYLFIGM